MEWPQELLEIFNEPEFVNVHPNSPRATTQDRIREAFRLINEWYREYQREPEETAERPERTYAIQLKRLRKNDGDREYLREWDEFNLLDMEL
jgi:hypothetical protein